MKLILYIPVLICLGYFNGCKTTQPMLLTSSSFNTDSIKRDSSKTQQINTILAPYAPHYDALQIKYSKYLNVEPYEIINLRLYAFIDKWLNTPYKWGGTDKNGIDCSAFVELLLNEIYNMNLPRTSFQQFFDEHVDKFSSNEYLTEGDLVFFRTIKGTVVSHVGLYLQNNMFVNAASHGVSIASLNDPYWSKRFIAAGRAK